MCYMGVCTSAYLVCARMHGWMSDVLGDVQVHMPMHMWKPEVNVIIFLYHSPFYILSP